MPSYHTSTSQVVEGFDSALTGGALALGSILIEQRAIRAADRREAAAIRQATARKAYNRIMAQHAIDEQARQARAEDDRRRAIIMRRALILKRAKG
jgi:hypothetical protein